MSGLTQVTLTNYNPQDEAWQTIDPAGQVSETFYDDAGNVIDSVQNVQTQSNGLPVMSSDANLATTYTYQSGQQVSTPTTFQPNTAGKAVSPGGLTGTTIDVPASAGVGTAFLLCDRIGDDPRFAQAGQNTGFEFVREGGQGWEYFSSTYDEWLSFTPQASDLLVATVNLSGGGSFEALARTSGIVNGSQRGYETASNFNVTIRT